MKTHKATEMMLLKKGSTAPGEVMKILLDVIFGE